LIAESLLLAVIVLLAAILWRLWTFQRFFIRLVRLTVDDVALLIVRMEYSLREIRESIENAEASSKPSDFK
jgi:hypothetical protein